MLTLRRLWAARSALAGVEFALVLPVLMLVLAGLVDLSMAVIMQRRVTVAAEDVGLVASTMAVQASSLNAITGQQAWQATTTPFALFPDWRAANATGFAITLSAVDFVATPSGCTTRCTGYTANTRWSVANPRGQLVLRPCGTLAAVPNGTGPSMTTLPAGVFGPSSVLVADVSAVFVPLFSSVFTGPVTILRSAYIPPRVNSTVSLTGSYPGRSIVCPTRST